MGLSIAHRAVVQFDMRDTSRFKASSFRSVADLVSLLKHADAEPGGRSELPEGHRLALQQLLKASRQ